MTFCSHIYYEYDVLPKAGCVELRRGPPDGDADGAYLGTSLVDSNSFLCIQFQNQEKKKKPGD